MNKWLGLGGLCSPGAILLEAPCLIRIGMEKSTTAIDNSSMSGIKKARGFAQTMGWSATL
jgi:hypothetical protein